MSHHAVFLTSAFTIVSVSTVATWGILIFMIADIRDFQNEAGYVLEEFKETADKAWTEMVEETKGKSTLELTMREKRFIKRDKGGNRVLIIHRRQIASSEHCICCPNEENEYGVNDNCPRGPQGAAGKPGLKGEPGSNGEHGRAGIHGVSFAVNRDCIMCPAGPQGPPGPDGVEGRMGQDGIPGNPGVAGRKGQAGPPGKRGEPGVDGQPGSAGAPGRRGPPMVKLIGKPGPKGPNGPPGPSGAQGSPGLPGAPGIPGDQGLRGPEGTPGVEGMAGRPGDVGATGFPGNDASYCPCPTRSLGVEGSSKYQPLGEYGRWRNLYEKKRT